MANVFLSASDIIFSRLRANADGKLPWAEVMNLALYAPGAGYYRQGVRKIGREGDFYTSVSVGSLYGELLGSLARQVWENMGKPDSFAVIEQGAHDGTLAFDILNALKDTDIEFFRALNYVIIEPDCLLQKAQHETLAPFLEKLEIAENWQAESLACRKGIIICNELLDAFTVHRVQWSSGEWQELYVEIENDTALKIVPGALSDNRLKTELDALEGAFHDGQIIEINLQALQWLREVHGSAFNGAIWLADYGHSQVDLFSWERSEGTLRRYFKHKSDNRVLENLGECDLTAHVNFTRLVVEAQQLGMTLVEFIEQGRFLSRLGIEIMKRPGFSPSPRWIRQFQSLTHPNHLGQSFQVLLLGAGDFDFGVSSQQQAAASQRLGLASR